MLLFVILDNQTKNIIINPTGDDFALNDGCFDTGSIFPGNRGKGTLSRA